MTILKLVSFMSRNTFFVNGGVYHICNFGVDGKVIFPSTKYFKRAVITLYYYLFKNLPIRLSRFLVLGVKEREFFFSELGQKEKRVEIISYCFMPNHFHFLLRQIEENGIQSFISDFSNSYTRYFNNRQGRIGPIFQGVFKPVLIENAEQILRVSRYIHINPVVSGLVSKDKLSDYLWSSLPEYLGEMEFEFCDKNIVLDQFESRSEYKSFVFSQIDYSQEIEDMKYLEQ